MTKQDITILAKENAFDLIGKEWMLVTAGTPDKYNTMTASWGGIGWLWNKPVAFIFIRPERFTHDFIEANDRLTLSFYGEEYRKALKETGVEISSFICVYRWSGPTEEQRKMAVANWKKMIEIAVNMGVPVINTELSGDPNQQEICNGMWFRSMEELLPIIEREGLRVEIQSHPYDFCELNDEACDMVKSFRSKNLGYVYSSPHGFFYDQGKGDVRHMLKYAGDELTHVLFADTFNQTLDCRYILNPPSLNQRGREDVSVHQHLNLGMGDVDFDGIFETLREMDFANKQLKPDAPKVGGDNIACVSIFGSPEKMNEWAPAARERIENELLKK